MEADTLCCIYVFVRVLSCVIQMLTPQTVCVSCLCGVWFWDVQEVSDGDVGAPLWEGETRKHASYQTLWIGVKGRLWLYPSTKDHNTGVSQKVHNTNSLWHCRVVLVIHLDHITLVSHDIDQSLLQHLLYLLVIHQTLLSRATYSNEWVHFHTSTSVWCGK